jgi:hypothetical protein
MNSRGHLIYGGSAASNMVAKIISTNQRQFNLNKMKHPSANLQRRYGDGSFEIDDSYWRQPPAPHRWDGGVARNTQQPQQTQQYVPLTEKIPSELAPRNYPVISRQPRNRFDTPTVEIPQPQFIQLTPQLSIPVQNLQNQNQSQLPMAIAEPTPRENFQPEAPKLSKKNISGEIMETENIEDRKIANKYKDNLTSDISKINKYMFKLIQEKFKENPDDEKIKELKIKLKKIISGDEAIKMKGYRNFVMRILEEMETKMPNTYKSRNSYKLSKKLLIYVMKIYNGLVGKGNQSYDELKPLLEEYDNFMDNKYKKSGMYVR